MQLIDIILQLDKQFLFFVQGFQNPVLTELFKLITLFGNPIPWFVLAAIIYWSGRENSAFHFMNVVLFTAFAVGILKSIVGRPRPSAIDFSVLGTDGFSTLSFPSGHATTISAYYAYLRKKLNLYGNLLFVLLVLAVMLSRLYLGMHFLTDVLAGALIGLVIGWLVDFFKRELAEHHFRLTKLEDELFVVAAVILSLAVLLLIGEARVLGGLFGFYTGFFLSKEMEIRAKNISHQKMLKKQGIGLAVLACLALPNLFLESNALSFTLMFIAGLWISFLYPLLFENVLNTRLR